MIVFFARPIPSWRTHVLRAVCLSGVTHCAPCSAGFVLERTFRECRIVREEAYVRLHSAHLWAVECGAEPVFFPEIQGPYPAWGAIRKRLLGRFAPWPDDCLGITCRLLLSAGVPVPPWTSTPAQLLKWLARDYHVEDFR